MQTRILIVRTSSLGDLVHMLPAISDIARHLPGAQIDWLVEEALAEIPTWHPAVHQAIVVAHRRWRRHWWAPDSRRERAALRARLAEQRYDLILDMQALLKSIWLVRQARGRRHGLDWKSAREPLASLFYDVRHRVEFWQPAIPRQRSLAGAALGYVPEGPPDFGLQSFTQGVSTEPVAMIMPSASRADKLWPEHDWQAVFDDLQGRGLALQLLAGSEAEQARAEALVRGRSGARVLPRMGLRAVAEHLARACIMVGLDSGLTHLSAGLGRPTIGIYKASTPVRTPLQGAGYTASLGERGQAPDAGQVCAAIQQAFEFSGKPLQ